MIPVRGEGIMVHRCERWLVGVGGVVFLGFSLGCMNLTIGGRTETLAPEDTVGLQRGRSSLPAGGESVVYYPCPYATPPNLELEDHSPRDSLQIIEQKSDCFRVKNLGPSPIDVSWKARGVRTITPAAPPPTVTLSSATPASP
jgi:hypothetical protein